MRTAKEDNLRRGGYSFSGKYSRDKEEAKRWAKEFRDQGFKAQVVGKVYPGRIYNVTGYSVWVKK